MLDTFIKKSILKHGAKYDYQKVKYKNNHTKVEIICPEHGGFFVRPSDHTSAGRGCQKCSLSKQTHSIDKFIENARRVHSNRYDYSHATYVNNGVKLKIICEHHGAFEQSPNNHLSGKGCKQCTFNSLQDFIENALLVHKRKFDYTKVVYKGSHEKVEIVCPLHGSFKQRADSHLRGADCPKCSNTISKKEIAWLDYLDISQDFRHISLYLPDRVRPLIVDAFDPTTNTVYEFYGDLWHGNPERYDQAAVHGMNSKIGTYGDVYQKTLLRESRIKEAGYNLVTVWETEWDEIKKMIA